MPAVKKIFNLMVLFATALLFVVGVPAVSGQSEGATTVFKIVVPEHQEEKLSQQLIKSGFEIVGRENGTVYMEYRGNNSFMRSNVVGVLGEGIRHWPFFLIAGILFLVTILCVIAIKREKDIEEPEDLSFSLYDYDNEAGGVINLRQRIADLQYPAIPQFGYSYSESFQLQPKIDYSVYNESNQFNLIRKWY